MNSFYFPSELNAADDPTRDRPVREPLSPELSSWLASAFAGDFTEFDIWLAERDSLPEDAVGLPPASSLVAVECQPLQRRSASLFKGNKSSKWLREVRSGSGSSAAKPSLRPPVQARPLPASVVALLQEFPDYQFVTSGEASLDRTSKGFLDLYSGSYGVARAVSKLTGAWVLTFELRRSAEENLLDPKLQARILLLINKGAFYAVGGGPICSSMSRAVRPPVRSSEYPEGLPECRDAMLEKVSQGNEHARFTAACVRAAIGVGCDHWTENPHTSFLWKQPAWAALLAEGLAEEGRRHGAFVTDYCRFGTKWRKRTRIYTSLALKGQKLLCSCTCEHQRLSGFSRLHGMMWTKVAEPYPRQLNHLLARALAETCKPLRDRHAVDAAAICRSSSRRIGRPRIRVLPLRILRTWSWLARWERLQPTTHRVPLPYAVLKAMIALALSWNWTRFAVVTGLAFFGAARPGEVLKACRAHVLLPADVLDCNLEACYVRIENPKSRNRGTGRVQHFAVREADFVRFLGVALQADKPETLLFPASPSTYRRRWDVLLKSLGIPSSAKLTPATLRGGGCVHLYNLGTYSIPNLMWQMRIKLSSRSRSIEYSSFFDFGCSS